MNFRPLYKILSIFLIPFALGACADNGGHLSGSLDSFYSLDFDQARARLYSSELAFEYVAADGQVPVRVSVHQADGNFRTGSYDLAKVGDITGQRGDSRIPRFISGTLTLEKFGGRDGDDIEAEFEATFQTGRDTSTLSGSISTQLEVIENPRGYGYDTGPDVGDAGDIGWDDAGDSGDLADAN